MNVAGPSDFSHSKKLAFAIVHYNAPEFALLNIKQISKLHPEAPIMVFDNNSAIQNRTKLVNGAGENVAFYLNRRDYSNKWCCHVLPLQYLLNDAAAKGVENLVFLDQDCILTQRVDALLKRFSEDILLIGARDYVVKSKPFGRLDHPAMRIWPSYVHASLMLLQPKVIYEKFGKTSLMGKNVFEAYHGISQKCRGKILFLETEMSRENPPLTRYFLGEETFAFHAWYSRISTMNPNETINYLSTDWIKQSVNKSYEFMRNLAD